MGELIMYHLPVSSPVKVFTSKSSKKNQIKKRKKKKRAKEAEDVSLEHARTSFCVSNEGVGISFPHVFGSLWVGMSLQTNKQTDKNKSCIQSCTLVCCIVMYGDELWNMYGDESTVAMYLVFESTFMYQHALSYVA